VFADVVDQFGGAAMITNSGAPASVDSWPTGAPKPTRSAASRRDVPKKGLIQTQRLHKSLCDSRASLENWAQQPIAQLPAVGGGQAISRPGIAKGHNWRPPAGAGGFVSD
jgi:hypothetical protein